MVPPSVQAAARVGWALAGLGLLGVFLSRRRQWPWLVLTTVAVAPSLAWAGDVDAATAGFLAVGITAAGALAFGRRWWPPYAIVAAGVILVLLLAPDVYAAFGLLFLAIEIGVAARLQHLIPIGVLRQPAHGAVRGADEKGFVP